jgi:hypothetical protein
VRNLGWKEHAMTMRVIVGDVPSDLFAAAGISLQSSSAAELPTLTAYSCESCGTPLMPFDPALHARVLRVEPGHTRAWCSIDCARPHVGLFAAAAQ